MQGCTTTGYIGILRAAPPKNSVAEKLPSTSFPREEMALTAMAAINIVARTLRTIVDHLIPCVDSQNPSQPPCRRSTPEIYSPAALLLMSLNAHYKQIAQGVLSAESGTHECQSAGAIPTHPSQTDLILASKIATFYVFFQKRN